MYKYIVKVLKKQAYISAKLIHRNRKYNLNVK